MEDIVFLATLPTDSTQMRVSRDGMRVFLDVPESEMARAVKLLTVRDQILEVRVKVVPQ